MYSGTTLTAASGRIIGAHQKIDRVARRHLKNLVKDNRIFPSTTAVLHFEGRNGPDGIKRKSPAVDEPWHFYSPFNNDDAVLIEIINAHYKQLVEHLKNDNRMRASFEAAWLAHALVDGLTPAHHYPYEEKLMEIRGGEGMETRNSMKEKLIMPGETASAMVKNNWKMWGPKGLFSMHGIFELGIASLISPLRLNNAEPTKEDVDEICEIGLVNYFKRRAREIAVLDMYGKFAKRGWTLRLMVSIRQQLAPTMVKTVTLAWYAGLIDAGLVKRPNPKKS